MAIRDIESGVEKTHGQLLSDVINFRRIIKDNLRPTLLQDVRDRKEVYIHILAPGGYEWTVAILAVLALGAIPSPLSVQYPLDETTYFIRKNTSCRNPRRIFEHTVSPEHLRRRSPTASASCIFQSNPPLARIQHLYPTYSSLQTITATSMLPVSLSSHPEQRDHQRLLSSERPQS